MPRPFKRLLRGRMRGNLVLIAIGVLIFASGAFLLLLAGGVIAVGEPSFINYILGVGATRSILSIVGVAMLASAFWVPKFVQRTMSKKQEIKVAASHHVRNRAQEVLFTLELLKEEGPMTDTQRKLIDQAVGGCEELIDSLTRIVASDGEKIDYSLAMKRYEKNTRK